jgi:hypothetical protein
VTGFKSCIELLKYVSTRMLSIHERADMLKKYEDRETLERIKRWPALVRRFSRVRIYSAEHCAYWRGTGQGYTDDPTDSAVWDCQAAFDRTSHCCPKKRIQFIRDNSILVTAGNNAIDIEQSKGE